jgi:flagellar protein FliS
MDPLPGIQRYQETDIQTMSPAKLVVLLYEALVRHIRKGKDAAAGDDVKLKTQSVNAAQAIISELRQALDHRQGGAIAGNLANLYDFMFQQNLAFMVDSDPTHLDNVLQVLEPLLGAWRSVCGQAQPAPEASPSTRARPEPAPPGLNPASYQNSNTIAPEQHLAAREPHPPEEALRERHGDPRTHTLSFSA